jgi:amino acid adenylation domain-containing protein
MDAGIKKYVSVMQLDFQGPVDIDFRKFEKEWLNKPVFELFAEVAQSNPDKIALKCGDKQLSYQETYNWAINIAQAIEAHNACKEPVGIALPNDVFFPVAMLAVLATGCPYVPLDIDLPIARNQLIIEQSAIKSIIVCADSPLFSETLHTINIDELAPYESTSIDFKASSDNIAYIIYTSGSTGIPKGVYQNQRNLLHDVMQYTNSIHLSENDRLTLLYSPSVNGAIRDIYGALLNGATLTIKNLKKTGLYNLSEFIRQESITIYHSIPNIFRTFLKLNPDATDFSSVRLIYLAGDRIYNTDVDLYKAFFPAKCLLYVGIGATEIATIYRQWFINHNTVINHELIPLGHAVTDREMQLLDEEGKEVPNGETGEITVSSQFISLGYWRNPEQTLQSFSESAHNHKIRTFRTGDLGKINGNGLLEFIGRKDNQVKINGYRVELSEIEGVLMNHPAIERCGVILHTIGQHNALFAFFASNKELPEIRVKNWLNERLPHYMIPQRCIQVNEIPTLHNFKNDNKALKALARKYTDERQNTENVLTGKNGFIYAVLRRTWSKFLDEKSFDKNISWKDAGGDSVNAVNFLVQLESDLDTTLPTDWIHGGMKPEEIYNYLANKNLTEQVIRNKIIYFFPSLLGIGDNTKLFLKSLSEYVSVKIINYPRFGDTPPKDRNLAYATSFLLKQMPEFNNPEAGFISSCSGSLIMNHMLTSQPSPNYKLIAILEGREIYAPKPIYKSFFSRLLSFLQKGDLLNGSLFYLYNHSDSCKQIIHSMEKKKYFSFKNRQVLWSIYPHLHPRFFEGEVLYFGCSNSHINSKGEHLKAYYRNVNLVSLNGNHGEIFNTENSKIVINTILKTLDKRVVQLS